MCKWCSLEIILIICKSPETEWCLGDIHNNIDLKDNVSLAPNHQDYDMFLSVILD